MTEDSRANEDNGVEKVNRLIQHRAIVEAPGKVAVEVLVPSYISYAHYQNQNLVSLRHGVKFRSRLLGDAEFGEFTLRVTLRCQGQDISETAFVALNSSPQDEPTPIPYKLNGEFLFEVREATPATFVFSILDGIDEIAFGSVDTEIFPPQLWSYGDEGELGTAGLLLSTFVRPRDPSLDSLLSKARELKGNYSNSRGERFSPATSGYQGDDEEVFAEVKALYEAVQASGIHYSNPASSLDWTIGQLIRTNDEILSAKAATCLDSTILFASLLENINIRPIIALIPNHAFVGFWTSTGQGRGFSSMVAPAEEGIAMLAREEPFLQFVETTRMCAGPDQVSFERAVTEASYRILGSLTRTENAERKIAELEAQGFSVPAGIVDAIHKQQRDDWRLIDITAARRAGYRPLAGRVKNPDGSTAIIEYAIENTPLNLNIQVDEAKVGLRQDNSPARVQYWKSQLLDLTFNNPLLNMGRRANTLKLFVPKGRLGEMEDFLQQNKGELKLSPAILELDGGFVSAAMRQDGAAPPELENQLDGTFLSDHTLLFEGPKRTLFRDREALRKASVTRVRNLSRASKNSIDETGINNLYMTFGSLRWKRKDANGVTGDYTVSPLILLPVVLRPIDRGRLWAVALDDSNDVATNETLALKLYQDWGISIPALTAPAEDDAGFDIPGLIRAVQSAIDEAKQTTWIVQQDATIGTYDFSTFHMWKDLNDNWSKLSEAPLVKHLIESDGTEVFSDPVANSEEISEEQLDQELAKVPVPSDGTQLRAVVKSLRGESFIIQGPPGTGKSQTITNLLARNLQEGKKVLFMSEKPAALEVVKDRLDEIRLGHFVLDLHSKNTSAESIRGQLIAAMDAAPKVDKVGIETEMFDFDVATKALAKYPERLHRVNDVQGHSVYSVRDTLLKLPETQELKLDRSCLNHFHGENLLKFKSNMENIQDVGELAGVAGSNPWSLSNLSTGLTAEQRESLSPLVRKLTGSIRAAIARPEVRATLGEVATFEEAQSLASLPEQLPTASELTLLGTMENQQRLSNHLELMSLLLSKIGAGYSAGFKFGHIPITDLESEYRIASETKIFRKKKMEALADKLRGYWAGTIDIDALGTSIQQAREVFDLGKKVADSSFGIPSLPIIENTELFAEGLLAERIQQARDLAALAQSFNSAGQGAMKSVLEMSAEARNLLVTTLESFVELAAILHVDSDSFKLWLAGGTLADRLSVVVESWETAALDGQHLSLMRWGNLLELLEDLRTAGQDAAYWQILSGEISFVEAPRAFDRARLRLLLDKLLDEHELANFNPGTQSANISKLRRSSDALRVYNRDTIASAVVKARTFDPTAIAGRAGALRSEINKQRGRLPIRQLMKKYWETITEITPCVAASPDSVARFLDVNLAHFDLVIFDEASQLRVPNSIGALGRGKAAIIVGDSKQMPPTSFFTPGGSDDDEDENLEFQVSQPDVDSILTMAEFSKLPSVMLKWHYRSQDEELIAFSNANYYQNELASFPSPKRKSGDERAVVLVRVKGAEYIRGTKKKVADEAVIADSAVEETTEIEIVETAASNTNTKEAQAVVNHIIELHRQFGPGLNLGVVTMNESQRKKIVEILERDADEELRKLLDSKLTKDYLFVRPLEKVQGDERDIIIMSIGFAEVPDPKNPGGFKLPQNFGPLTKAGSEKRLNVAVTRARKRVYVFCSFDPNLLRITDTSSEGMKGLKEYLLLAQNGPEGSAIGNQSSFEEPDRHRIDVARSIEDMGFKVSQNVGLSNFKVDIAISHPERPEEYLLAILLDGPGWRSRPAANDRDVLPIGVLEKNMGWKSVERIWLPVWLKDRSGELARIQARVRELASLTDEPKGPVAEVQVTDLPDIGELLAATHPVDTGTIGAINIEKGSVGINIDDVEPFAETIPKLVTTDKTMLQYTEHPEIKRVIGDLVRVLTNIEGPVHPDRAVNFIAKSFGLSHVQSARATAILTAIPRAEFTRDSEGFIYPSGVSISSYGSWKRKNKGEPRDIAMTSLTELGNAMRYLCERTHGLEKEELLRQTMLAFGPKTLSAPIRKRLELALQTAATRRQIVLDGDHFIPGSL